MENYVLHDCTHKEPFPSPCLDLALAPDLATLSQTGWSAGTLPGPHAALAKHALKARAAGQGFGGVAVLSNAVRSRPFSSLDQTVAYSSLHARLVGDRGSSTQQWRSEAMAVSARNAGGAALRQGKLAPAGGSRRTAAEGAKQERRSAGETGCLFNRAERNSASRALLTLQSPV
ncbi:hypothetical protein SKAU_G00148360 [Synaphobranchus kaupii]|uniref:Uncharacterized protein n=1 Tax=Synaphobranchus kaupii TaxID=118154 RepID=A0A9Q1J539_SYNKA|nr:hypothetical protein SKAU_G00148360 [Synaphobranchus kaupii]